MHPPDERGFLVVGSVAIVTNSRTLHDGVDHMGRIEEPLDMCVALR